MPRTNYHLQRGNPVEKAFWGQLPIERATSFFYYQRGSSYKSILFNLKYKGRKEVGEVMGRMVAAELSQSDFFSSVDLIVPVPLHPDKQKKRGYNQSEWIAKGVQSITQLPIDTGSVERTKNTETQTQKSRIGRWENVKEIFVLHQPGQFVNKHILIIDDVLTTGSTIAACASVFNEVEGAKVTVLTMALAQD